MVYKFFSTLQNWLLPERCFICRQPAQPGLTVCTQCSTSLPTNQHPCRVCAQPLETEKMTCGQCQHMAPSYNRVLAPLRYRNEVRQLIIDLKFNGKLRNARLLAEIFHRHTPDDNLADCLLPIPLHPKRLRERGYNQSVEIARHLSRITRVRLDVTSAKRVRHTKRQSELSLKDKKSNVRGAFTVSFSAVPRNVAIIDDVMTSGHTVNELARVLKQAGVETVYVWAMARAGQF